MKSLLPVISALECTVVKQKDTCKSWPKIIQLILCFKYESREGQNSRFVLPGF